MTAAFEAALRGPCAAGHVDAPIPPLDGECMSCSTAHLEELGACVGIVQGDLDYNDVPSTHPTWRPEAVGPELEVRWQPSNLRYGYAEGDLELVPPAAPEA